VLIRLLIFCLTLFALLLVIRALLSLGRNRSKPLRRHARSDADEMVLDPQCHSYLPKEEAILQEGRYFCSRECANLYLSR
jgi:Prokaryotic metallothionein